MDFQFKHFATIRISVKDVGKSRDWYKKFFDLEPEEDHRDFVRFRVSGTCFDISFADEKSPISAGGGVGYWLVDSLDAAIEKAIGQGGAVYRGPLKVSEDNRIVQIKDPYGNVFGLEE